MTCELITLAFEQADDLVQVSYMQFAVRASKRLQEAIPNDMSNFKGWGSRNS